MIFVLSLGRAVLDGRFGGVNFTNGSDIVDSEERNIREGKCDSGI